MIITFLRAFSVLSWLNFMAGIRSFRGTGSTFRLVFLKVLITINNLIRNYYTYKFTNCNYN